MSDGRILFKPDPWNKDIFNKENLNSIAIGLMIHLCRHCVLDALHAMYPLLDNGQFVRQHPLY